MDMDRPEDSLHPCRILLCPLTVPSGTFTLLAYTNDSLEAVPATWDDADPHLIDRGKVEQVRLRSFSTNVHSLEVSCRDTFDLEADRPRRWWHIELENRHY